MERVTGIGGVFFKARDPVTMKAWYRGRLGIPVEEGGWATFVWHEGSTPERPGSTVFSLFSADTGYFGPGPAPFMINFRVADLDALLEQLRAQGVEIARGVEQEEAGRFAWVVDPEGNRVELWEPAEGN